MKKSSRSKKLIYLRKEYMSRILDEKATAHSPLTQFTKWFDEATKLCQFEVNAATLATCSKSGRPAARQILLKELDQKGFVFFSNYTSRKALDLEATPYAALLFYWPDIERQVRVEGRIEKVSNKESDAYFATRPRGSQLGAWASNQSSPVKTRSILEKRLSYFEKLYRDQSIPRPPHWGGYRLIPNQVEFWQGRPNRLHDRILYRLQKQRWIKMRLAP